LLFEFGELADFQMRFNDLLYFAFVFGLERAGRALATEAAPPVASGREAFGRKILVTNSLIDDRFLFQ